jgi:ATP-dependent Lon protease
LPDPTDSAAPNAASHYAEPGPVVTARRLRNRGQSNPEPIRHASALSLPTLTVGDVFVYPRLSVPFPVEDDESAMVFERASRRPDRLVFLVCERPVVPTDAHEQGGEFDAARIKEFFSTIEHESTFEGDGWESEPLSPAGTAYEMCPVGIIAEVGQIGASGTRMQHAMIQGVSRGIVIDVDEEDGITVCTVHPFDDPVPAKSASEAPMAALIDQIESYVNMHPGAPEDVLTMLQGIEQPGHLADLVAISPEFTPHQRQQIVEMLDPLERLRAVSVIVEKRLAVLSLRNAIVADAQSGMDKQQREYFLREQIRSIQKELGEGTTEETLAKDLRQRVEDAGMPEDVKTKTLEQVDRLEQQHPFSPEIGVIRTYVEWLIELPWSTETEDVLDLEEAARILNEDHYGIDKVKERILEYIAVRKLAGDKLRAPIICFVGPPGVGKTSLGRSIARAIGRNYVRMSLGGVRDEAEIRGHRRTYVGAMPGRVIKALRDAKSRNPVLVLDEIDKVGSDAFRGDPSSALLEVLDPEQNATFSDHFLEVPFDLSKVIFITTANIVEPIPPALRDRMEIIEVTGYTEAEKLAIARQYLMPKTLESHGLTDEMIEITDDALTQVIRVYTEESGVRNLEREIGSICRKAARKIAGLDQPEKIRIDANELQELLGVPRYEFGLAEEQDEIGVATGAAVTSVGGDLLSIEVTIMEGKGELILTGQLGEIMQESGRAAISYARSHAAEFNVAPGFFDKHNIHVHIPAGAIPKDGPSAGITIATALISALTGRRVRKDVAMTGEMTLRGKVLPIGGLKEKSLAAHRGGVTTFIFPRRNAKDLAELPELVKTDVHLLQVSTIDEVLDIALLPAEQPTLRVAESVA